MSLTLYAKLPTELKLKIWTYTVIAIGRRYYEIKYLPNNPRKGTIIAFDKHYTPIPSHQLINPLFTLDTASRSIALLSWSYTLTSVPPHVTFFNQPIDIHINFSIDILVFRAGMNNNVDFMALAGKLTAGSLLPLKHIALILDCHSLQLQNHNYMRSYGNMLVEHLYVRCPDLETFGIWNDDRLGVAGGGGAGGGGEDVCRWAAQARAGTLYGVGRVEVYASRR
jgi:hypothetical protein